MCLFNLSRFVPVPWTYGILYQRGVSLAYHLDVVEENGVFITRRLKAKVTFRINIVLHPKLLRLHQAKEFATLLLSSWFT